MLNSKPKVHGFSVDFEEWFHILQSAKSPKASTWNYVEPRIDVIGIRLLDLLDLYNITLAILPKSTNSLQKSA